MPIEYDPSVSSRKHKTFTIDGSIYSLTYFSLLKKNKAEYKMTKQDQFDLFAKTGLMFAVQFFFIYALLHLDRKAVEF